jgi:uncharacterized membrane protein
MDYANHMDRGGWIFPAFFVLVLIVLAVVAIVWLARSRSTNPAPGRWGRSEGSARDVLDRRLVSGEIGEDEYRRLRAVLSDAPPPSQPQGEP